MKKEYIADCLANYAKSGAVRLHMPGHKGKVEGSLGDAYSRDITELSFSDNLANPSGVIMLAEKDMFARYEQTMLAIKTLEYFGHKEGVFFKTLEGTHCSYVNKGEPAFVEEILAFINKIR